MSNGCEAEPVAAGPRRLTRRQKWLAALLIMALLVASVPLLLRSLGWLRAASIPAASMAPALCPGDHVFIEGISLMWREPQLGEVVVFRTDGLSSLPPGQLYLKRVAGSPGDQVRVSEGKLFVNGKETCLSNSAGPIAYVGSGTPIPMPFVNMRVPAGSYYVLGDNTTNSLDSRYYGCIPRKNIVGRVSLCYWPPERLGKVR